MMDAVDSKRKCIFQPPKNACERIHYYFVKCHLSKILTEVMTDALCSSVSVRYVDKLVEVNTDYQFNGGKSVKRKM